MTAAKWFRQPDVKCAFTAKFNSTSNIQDKLFYVIAEFILTTFKAGTSFTLSHLKMVSARSDRDFL
jgi:hypothetical protein